jgi:hypothetical protein
MHPRMAAARAWPARLCRQLPTSQESPTVCCQAPAKQGWKGEQRSKPTWSPSRAPAARCSCCAWRAAASRQRCCAGRTRLRAGARARRSASAPAAALSRPRMTTARSRCMPSTRRRLRWCTHAPWRPPPRANPARRRRRRLSGGRAACTPGGAAPTCCSATPWLTAGAGATLPVAGLQRRWRPPRSGCCPAAYAVPAAWVAVAPAGRC